MSYGNIFTGLNFTILSLKIAPCWRRNSVHFGVFTTRTVQDVYNLIRAEHPELKNTQLTGCSTGSSVVWDASEVFPTWEKILEGNERFVNVIFMERNELYRLSILHCKLL